MKYTIEGMNRRLEEAEEWISELEDRVVESNQAEEQKTSKNEMLLRALQQLQIEQCSHNTVPRRRREKQRGRKSIRRSNS